MCWPRSARARPGGPWWASWPTWWPWWSSWPTCWPLWSCAGPGRPALDLVALVVILADLVADRPALAQVGPGGHALDLLALVVILADLLQPTGPRWPLVGGGGKVQRKSPVERRWVFCAKKSPMEITRSPTTRPRWSCARPGGRPARAGPGTKSPRESVSWPARARPGGPGGHPGRPGGPGGHVLAQVGPRSTWWSWWSWWASWPTGPRWPRNEKPARVCFLAGPGPLPHCPRSHGIRAYGRDLCVFV
jgi:hypothetical protein